MNIACLSAKTVKVRNSGHPMTRLSCYINLHTAFYAISIIITFYTSKPSYFTFPDDQ